MSLSDELAYRQAIDIARDRAELQRFREIDYCPSCAAKLFEAGLEVDVNQEPEEEG